MDPAEVEKLRRDKAVQSLPDGREGVMVTVQYQGPVPAVPRAARKTWLEKEITDAVKRVDRVKRRGPAQAVIVPDSVSVSAQTMEAVVPVDELEEFCQQLSQMQCRVDVSRRRQILSRP